MTFKTILAHMGGRRGAYRVLMGRREGKRRLGKPGCKWEDNIKIYLREVGWGVMDWIDFTEDRERRRALVNALMNFYIAHDRSNWSPSFSSITFQFFKGVSDLSSFILHMIDPTDLHPSPASHFSFLKVFLISFLLYWTWSIQLISILLQHHITFQFFKGVSDLFSWASKYQHRTVLLGLRECIKPLLTLE